MRKGLFLYGESYIYLSPFGDESKAFLASSLLILGAIQDPGIEMIFLQFIAEERSFTIPGRRGKRNRSVQREPIAFLGLEVKTDGVY